MKPSNLGQFDHLAKFRSLNLSWLGGILGERQVSARALVIGEVQIQDPLQRRFIEHNHVIQAFSPDGS